ncbi:MAG: cobalt ECF transporter T component CbiQ [Chloroflexota bacterium]
MTSPGTLLDRYIAGVSPLHRLEAKVKVLLTVAFILAVTSLPVGAWPFLAAFAALALAGLFLSRLPPHRVLARSMLALPFVLVAVPTLFTRPGPALFTIPLLSWQVTATREGLSFVLTVLAKSWVSVLAATLLVSTTRFTDLLEALRGLRIPKVMVAILSFMYRYLFVLIDEAMRMARAREARSARLGPRPGGSAIWRGRVLGGMVGSLFIRTYERSERIYMAMLARGYDGQIRLLETPRVSLRSWAVVGIVVHILAALAASARFL